VSDFKKGGRQYLSLILIPGPIPTFRFAWFTAVYVRHSPIADIGTHARDVRFVPKADMRYVLFSCPIRTLSGWRPESA